MPKESTLFTQLLQSRLQALEDLVQLLAVGFSCTQMLPCSMYCRCSSTHLKLDLSLGNILVAAVSGGNLLRLRNLVPDGLVLC
jgi:hypothetical protein